MTGLLVLAWDADAKSACNNCGLILTTLATVEGGGAPGGVGKVPLVEVLRVAVLEDTGVVWPEDDWEEREDCLTDSIGVGDTATGDEI